ncbi:MAG: M48 family metallopeptidase [Elusimicrobiota bacterium]|jgi:heat shock protein HtpX|nr:M48 family metallopeptidase [Elusimicrobiota bacterium]
MKTNKFIAANRRKTILLMALFPITFVLLIYAVIILVSLFSAPSGSETAAYNQMGASYDVIDAANMLAMQILPIAAVISVIFILISYFSGHNFILSTAGAVQLNESNAPEIIGMVKNLAEKAKLPMPKVYAINDKNLNAFATGRNPKNSYVVLTKGIANTLNKEELEGVIAHELSHIKNYDIRLMLITIVCITFSVIAAEMVLRYAFFSRRSDSKNGAAIQILLIVLAIALYLYGYLIAPLIRLAISRTREFQADASAALITGNANGLINALRKISGHSVIENLNDKETIAPICIATPLKSSKQNSLFSKWSGLFATHPPIEARIKALEALENDRLTSGIFSGSSATNPISYR